MKFASLFASQLSGRVFLVALLTVSLAGKAAPLWAAPKPDKTKAAEDLICDGCVDSTDVEDGSLTRDDLGFDPQERVQGSCPIGWAIREIKETGELTCEYVEQGPKGDKGDPGPSGLAELVATCPAGSFLQLDPADSGEWLCLSRKDMKLVMGFTTKVVFVTGSTFNGNLEDPAYYAGWNYLYGDNSASFLCNQSAIGAGLQSPGEKKFFAWISYGADNPVDRVDPSAVYVRTDGEIVFDKADLQGCTVDADCLDNPISLDENSVPVGDPLAVWTNVAANGTAKHNDDYSTCAGWTTSAQYVGKPPIGSAIEKSTWWTDKYVSNCEYSARLYCMEK